MKRGRAAAAFIGIGLALYAAAWAASERLVLRTGHANPFYKMAVAPAGPVDWVVLGASHAMPLDFADFNAMMERATGRRILNLASPGTGPLYNRFVLEHFVESRRAGNLLYVADSFAFRSRAWNEDRFGDAKLLRRTPFEWRLARRLAAYVGGEDVDVRALLDYTTGFSKLNNRERFQRDAWEGEAQFDRVARPSRSAVDKRIEYLYPHGTAPATLARYLDEFAALLDVASRAGMRVTVVKLPVPTAYRDALPDEDAFDAALTTLLARRGVAWRDWSAAVADPKAYFDTDHLNRAGLTAFFERELRALFAARDGGERRAD
jgi:hypothetical protein